MSRRRSVMTWFSGNVFLVGGVAAIAVLHSEKRAPETLETANIVRPIPTALVQASVGHSLRLFPGRVRAKRRVELAFSVSGLLEQLNAEEGCSLRRGEILAGLDQRDYACALDISKAKYVQAKRELDRYRKLWQQKIVTDAEYEIAETTHDIALAELRIRQKALEDTVLHAPFDGIVVRRHVENYEHVQTRQAIVSFQDISFIEVVIQVPERLIVHGGPGVLRGLEVHFDASGERWFDAVVREHSAESDDVTQTYDVVVGLVPPTDLEVLPGMTATVKAKIAESPTDSRPTDGSMRIPADALCRDDDGGVYVWVIDPAGGNPVKKSVDPTRLCGAYVEIRSGLHPGEHVAIAGLHELREDIRVRPMASGKEGLDG